MTPLTLLSQTIASLEQNRAYGISLLDERKANQDEGKPNSHRPSELEKRLAACQQADNEHLRIISEVWEQANEEAKKITEKELNEQHPAIQAAEFYMLQDASEIENHAREFLG